MHKNALGYPINKVIDQIKRKEKSVHNYSSYIPIKNAPKKLKNWEKEGHTLIYLTSRRKREEINQIRTVLKRYKFPNGKLLFRKKDENYSNIAERIMPDILVEDDCKSIGGKKEMTITNINPKIKKKIKSIVLREFGGIDNLPDILSK